jgi:hypothetical protein
MKKLAKKRKRVTVKAVPTPDKTLGMKTKKAKVSKVRGKFFVTVGRRKLEIPVGPVISAQDVNKLVGKDVFVALSNKRPSEIVAIGIWPLRVRCYWILCYLPAPDILRRVQSTIRQTLLNKMVSTRILTPKLGRQIKANMPR